MANIEDNLNIGYDFSGPINTCMMSTTKEVKKAGHSHVINTSWSTDKDLENADNEIASFITGRVLSQVSFWDKEAIVHLSKNGETLAAIITGKTIEACNTSKKNLRKIYPQSKNISKDRRARVKFWFKGVHGVSSFTRRIAVPSWDEIAKNYPSEVREELAEMQNWKPDASGKLLIWSGPAGTGKTYAIRSLCNAWREWADVHYVVDPEYFLGDGSYLMDLISDADEEFQDVDEDKYMFIVLEDTGELLSADAKDRTGQGLSRLLNLADGMLGQGIKLFALISTNEEVKHMHDAVTRPGRCASQIVFRPFHDHEATEWLDNKFSVPQSTLAELYSYKQKGEAAVKKRGRVGFS